MAAGGHHADTADDLGTVGGRSRDIVGAQRGGGGVSGDQEGRDERADTSRTFAPSRGGGPDRNTCAVARYLPIFVPGEQRAFVSPSAQPVKEEALQFQARHVPAIMSAYSINSIRYGDTRMMAWQRATMARSPRFNVTLRCASTRRSRLTTMCTAASCRTC
jgi:hypothetical protein